MFAAAYLPNLVGILIYLIGVKNSGDILQRSTILVADKMLSRNIMIIASVAVNLLILLNLNWLIA